MVPILSHHQKVYLIEARYVLLPSITVTIPVKILMLFWVWILLLSCKAKFFQAFIDCQLWCSLKRYIILLVLVVRSFVYIVPFRPVSSFFVCLIPYWTEQFSSTQNNSKQIKTIWNNSSQFKTIQNNSRQFETINTIQNNFGSAIFLSNWQNKQQSDQCKIPLDGVLIGSGTFATILFYLEPLVKGKCCKFRGLCLHSMSVVILLNILSWQLQSTHEFIPWCFSCSRRMKKKITYLKKFGFTLEQFRQRLRVLELILILRPTFSNIWGSLKRKFTSF